MNLIVGVFPLLAIPVIIYNLMAFGFHDSAAAANMAVAIGDVSKPVLAIHMVSGDTNWPITSGDILVMLSLVFFFFEVLKSTSTGTASILNHAVSMILFIVALIEFLLLKNFATSTFFILTIMCLLDVLAGVVVTIVSARRDFSVGDSH